jgi:hypothetical protein
MKIAFLVTAVAAPIMLFACATSQGPLVHDDVDRLFLKYAEIAQRPSPMSADEADEIGKITGQIRSSADPCLAKKFLKLFPVTSLLTAGASATPAGAADIENKKAEAKQYLKGLQAAPTAGDTCPYSGFPAVPVN